MAPSVSVVIVAYNNGSELIDCVDAVLKEADATEIVVVVNGDSLGVAPELTQRTRVTVIDPGKNLGFAAGCNLGVSKADGDVLVFLNPDALPLPGALDALCRAATAADVGLVMPRLRLRSDPDLLNSAGGALHLCGLGWASSYRQPADEVRTTSEIAAASGAAMAIRRDVFVSLGGFLEELFCYHEDAELSWRAHLQGLRVILIPDADVLHAYEFSRHPLKYELLDRNRLIFVLTLYSGRLLWLLSPVLLAYEIAIVAVATRQGWLAAKIRGWRWLWQHREWLRTRRKDMQTARQVPDRQLSRFLTPNLNPGQLGLPPGTRLASVLLSWYWSLARRLL